MNKKMKVIGLTGGTGSGKSIVSCSLKQKKAYIIDCDEIAHQILLPGEKAYEEVVDHYGQSILDENGIILRKKLGEIVFSNPNELAFLNLITHKYIILKIKQELVKTEKLTDQYHFIVIDAPLLIEANLMSLCDQIWVLFAEEEVRLKRIMDRDHLTYEQAWNRIQNQKSWKEYERIADIIIDNSQDVSFLNHQLQNAVSSIL